MASQLGFMRAGVVAAILLAPGWLLAAPSQKSKDQRPQAQSVEMFQAMKDGVIDVKFIPKDAKEANVLIENKTKKPLSVKLPEAFAGVPVQVAAQFGMGGMGGGMRGGMGGGMMGGMGGMGMGGMMQGMGGGMGMMGGMGMGGMGGMRGGMGGGMFNIPPEKVAKIEVACVCLDHGKPDPTPRAKYVIVPAEMYVKNAAVIELLKVFGRGGLDRQAVQAAVWHMNNGLEWPELAAKIGYEGLRGEKTPYFRPNELRAAFYMTRVSQRLAEKAKPTASVSSER